MDRPDRAGPPADAPGSPTGGTGPATLTRGFLFADLRGYTAYLDRRGAASAAALLERFRGLVRAAVAAHHGAEIRTEGDSFYVVFPSASGAVACALDIVRAAADEVVRPDDAIAVGVGVHAGEALDTPEGPVGTAVNIAARLCAMAGPGEVVVSDTVRALTRSVGSAGFVPLGRRPIKGLDESLTVYRAMPAGAALPRPPRSAARGRGLLAVALGGVGIVAAVVLVVAGGALGGSGGSTPGPSPSSVAASDAATPGGPSDSPSPSDAVTTLSVPTFDDDTPYDPVELTPGRYRLEEFRPATELEIFGAGWDATEELPDGFTLNFRQGGESNPVDGLITGGVIQVVFAGPCFDAATETIALDPRSIVEWLRANPYLEVTDPRSANLGTWTGLTVDVTQAQDPDCTPPEELPPEAQDRMRTAVYLFQFADNTFWLGPDEKARVVVVDVDGRPVTVVADAVEAAGFDEFMDRAQPILDSFRFDPDG